MKFAQSWLARAGVLAAVAGLPACGAPPMWRDGTPPAGARRTPPPASRSQSPVWVAYGLSTWPTWSIGAGDVQTALGIDQVALGIAGLVLPPLGALGPSPGSGPAPRRVQPEDLTPRPRDEDDPGMFLDFVP